MADVLRVANCSGFYGDRLAAMREMVDGGPIDVLTGDYLAELTLLILLRSRAKDPTKGYATTFLRQLEDVLGTVAERGITVVTNAGGLNPAGCADAVRALAERLGVPLPVAHVEGDDVLAALPGLQAAGEPLAHLDTGVALADAGVSPLAANAYLGCWGVVEALAGGARVVVTGRVTDASLVVGPAAHRFGWARDDWDALAGATVAGHLLECGAQATGGNYAFFREIRDLRSPGFPLAEIAADGSSVVTKHPGTGGQVSVGTLTAQLLYEIGGPAYEGPDVVTRFDTVQLTAQGPDRVGVSGTRGGPPSGRLKVAMNHLAGFRNRVELILTGLDIEAKAELAEGQLLAALPRTPSVVDAHLARLDRPDADTEEQASAVLRVTVKDPDPAVVGRAFSSAAVELALASYPGFSLTAPPGDAAPYGVYWPTLVPADAVQQVVVHADGRRVTVPHTAGGPPPAAPPPPDPAAPGDPPDGPTRRVPLGVLAGARSGDKGGTANIGLWVRDPAAYPWLVALLTPDGVRRLLPEAEQLPVQCHPLPHLLAVNVVLPGLLGEGVSATTRFDPQAKGLGEHLRSRLVDVPEVLLTPLTA